MWALDLLDTVVQYERLASRPSPHTRGEWDALRAYSPRVRRRLIGAGYMIPGGLQPDQLAELICARVPEAVDVDSAIAWYVKTCLAAIGEARTEAGRARRARLARRNGYPTYYAYRNAMSKAKGYGSLWDERRMRRWN